MYQDNIVLCGASSYEQKYYFNQDFASLPEAVKQELQIMCVLFTEDVGGILTLEFDEDGNLQFKTEALEADARFDEIGSALKIKELQPASVQTQDYQPESSLLKRDYLIHSSCIFLTLWQ